MTALVTVNRCAELHACSHVILGHWANGSTRVRLSTWRATHEQKGLLHVKAERGVEAIRARVEGILDEAHTRSLSPALDDALHQPPSRTATLHRRVHSDRSNPTDRITFRKEVAAD